MNKSEFIKELSKQTSYNEERCNTINNIVEDTFIIGKKNKEKIVKQRQSEAFDTEYTAFEQTLVRQLNEELWNSVTMIHQDDVKTSSFFEVYQMYFQHQE